MEKLWRFYLNLPRESLELALGIMEKMSKTLESSPDKEKDQLERWRSINNDLFKFFLRPVELLAGSAKNSTQEEPENFIKDWFNLLTGYSAKALDLNNKVMENYLQVIKMYQEQNLKAWESWLSVLREMVNQVEEKEVEVVQA